MKMYELVRPCAWKCALNGMCLLLSDWAILIVVVLNSNAEGFVHYSFHCTVSPGETWIIRNSGIWNLLWNSCSNCFTMCKKLLFCSDCSFESVFAEFSWKRSLSLCCCWVFIPDGGEMICRDDVWHCLLHWFFVIALCDFRFDLFRNSFPETH